MKRIIPFFLIIFFASGVFAQVGTLTVTNVDSEAGTGITEIEYEFTGDAGTYDISAKVSFNNGADYSPIPEADLTGQLTNVIPGTYSLTWNGSASFPETYSDETIVKITANFTWQCGDDITFYYRNIQVTYGTVSKTYNKGTVNEFTLCWMDRNLGAKPMPFVPAVDATGKNDARLYGDLFQWGRLDDGHQVRDPLSGTTGAQSSVPNPGHSNFITGHLNWYNGTSPNPNDLWRGENEDGTVINNPCPIGWHVPRMSELDAEHLSWVPQKSSGAYASALKWPVGGGRSGGGGVSGDNYSGSIWSSSLYGSESSYIAYDSNGTMASGRYRAQGMSVRCVREQP